MSVNSPIFSAVDNTNKYFSAPENEGIAHKSGRVFTRSIANTALSTVALVATVAAAALTIITSPLYISSYTKGAFDWAKNHTIASASATRNAFAGIIGRAQVTEEPAPAPAPKTRWETFKEAAANVSSSVWNKGVQAYEATKSEAQKLESQTVVGAIGTVVITALAYYKGGVAVQAIKDNAPTWEGTKTTFNYVKSFVFTPETAAEA